MRDRRGGSQLGTSRRRLRRLTCCRRPWRRRRSSGAVREVQLQLEPRGRPPEWVGRVHESLEGSCQARALGRGARRVDCVVDANPVVGVAVGESALKRHPASNWVLKGGWGRNRRHPREAPAGRRADVARNGLRAGSRAGRMRMLEEHCAGADLPDRQAVGEAREARRVACGRRRGSGNCAGGGGLRSERRRAEREAGEECCAQGERRDVCVRHLRRSLNDACSMADPQPLHRFLAQACLRRSRAAWRCEMLVSTWLM
jgi:hypothetical protein